MTDLSGSKPNTPRSTGKLILLGGLMLFAIATFVALGIWQVERLYWKRDLITRVDQRIHAAPVPAPEGAAIDATADEYLRVTATGTFDNSKETLVYASTELGPGYWVMTPLRLEDGNAILINRGFVPLEKRDPKMRTEGQLSGLVNITGLLRPTEPKGSLLQSNDPKTGWWYSRDVAAIAADKGIGKIEPYFIDADEAPNPGGVPVGGLTRVVFPNSHLSYAITWFAMALMVIGLFAAAVRSELRRR